MDPVGFIVDLPGRLGSFIAAHPVPAVALLIAGVIAGSALVHRRNGGI